MLLKVSNKDKALGDKKIKRNIQGGFCVKTSVDIFWSIKLISSPEYSKWCYDWQN